MKILVKKMDGLTLPNQATPKDAAYDIVATTDPKIVGEFISRPVDGLAAYKRVTYIEYGTNLFIAPQAEPMVFTGQPVDYHTMIFPRSSISKYNLVMCNSVATIDNPYRGQIMVRFKYTFQPEDLIVLPEAGGTHIYGVVNQASIYQKGDRICQIKACANIPIEFELVDNLDETQRGEGGFGSTGK